MADRLQPTWTWPQIEAAILKAPLTLFGAHNFGDTSEDGQRMVRARLSDNIRRELVAQLDARKDPTQ